jgi:uncharacterized membrane protein
VLFLFSANHLSIVSRALLGWDAATLVYLSLALFLMTRATPERMRNRAIEQDDGARTVLLLILLACVFSIAAIVLELANVKDLPAHVQHLHIGLVAVTLVCSWLLMHTIFALHYAHEFYICDADRPALDFPGQTQPDYWDFMYFSFVIGATSQTADVNLRSTTMRRLALLHGTLAFFFNTTLLALTINIAAGLL